MPVIMERTPDREARVAVIGHVCTGKTSFVYRLVERNYGPSDEQYRTTVGFTEYTTVATSRRVYPSVDVLNGVCHVVREDTVVRISLYDIPCQAERTDLAVAAMNRADVALFVVDRRRKCTMEYVLGMLRTCTARRRILLANFEDGKREDDPPLTEIEDSGEGDAVLGKCSEVAETVLDYVLEYAECSTKTGVGVREACALVCRVAGLVAKPIERPLKKERCNV